MIAVTSPGFVLFAALLAGLWYACPPPRRWQLLLGANLLFYAVLCPAALPVLAGSSFLVWWCGRRTAKKPVFLAGLAAALLPLALLKYLPAALGWQGTLANALGIGYFTLQLVSYLCDVRRGRILPEEKYARLLCYASFFLSITQGPFNRYDALMPQLDRPTVWNTDRVWRGVQRSAWGYFKKLAVADRAAVVVDAVFANPAAFDRTQLLLGGVLFTVQLYADFSGCMDIVQGISELFGITLEKNFDHPFTSRSVAEWWRRWHITLCQWMKDYVYFPLAVSPHLIKVGGKLKKRFNAKVGKAFVTIVTIGVVWLLTGLWHGASWNFILWGLYFAAWLILERYVLRGVLEKTPAILKHLYTLIVVFVGWGVFAMENLTVCAGYFKTCFGSGTLWSAADGYYLTAYGLTLLLLTVGSTRLPRKVWNRLPERARDLLGPLLMAAGLVICTAYLVDGSYNPFLYFRF